jgi:hypothetical protein
MNGNGSHDQGRFFAEVMQDIMIVLLILSMVLIAQQFSMTVYKAGIVLLVVATFFQIGFGNIPSRTKFGRSLKLLGIALLIIFFVFGLGAVLAPIFVNIVRG